MQKFKNYSLYILVVFAFSIRFYLSFIDKFLHPWDEKFHALVARNMMNNPWIPMLRAHPAIDNYDKFAWCCNSIWIHKQPLFLWQMALSMKIFGVNEWALRLPSVLMGTISILLIYKIAFIISNKNKTISLLSAFLLSISQMSIFLNTGIYGMDHNDTAHGFYILASMWAYFEFIQNKNWKWAFFIGLFAGAAILNKWLTGLYVYLAWFLYIIFSFKKLNLKSEFIYFVFSLFICCLVFLPWQIYIKTKFPELAAFEYEFNRRHITEALEGHSGSVSYYLINLKKIIGNYIYWLIPIGIFLGLKIKYYPKTLISIIFIPVLFVFLFYSLIVKTKVEEHIFYIVPFIYIFISFALYHIFFILRSAPLNILVISLIFIFVFKPKKLVDYLSKNNKERNIQLYNADIYRNLKKYIPQNTKLIMNVNSYEDIDVMFYNNNLTAYHWTFNKSDFDSLLTKKIRMAVFENHGNYSIPEYYYTYPNLFIIKKKLEN